MTVEEDHPSYAEGRAHQSGHVGHAPADNAVQPVAKAGWYADPNGSFKLRYWDGAAWTQHVRHPSSPNASDSLPSATLTASRLASEAVTDLRSLPYSMLFPVREWWRDRMWARGWTAVFLAGVLVPFILSYLADSGEDFGNIAKGLAAYFGVVWLLALRALIRPEHVPARVIAGVAAFALLVSTSGVQVISQVLNLGTPSTLPGWIVQVGFLEESAKAFALVALLFKFDKARLLDLRDYLFLGAVSGIAFGVSEAALYTQWYGQGVSVGSETISVTVWRLVSGPALHAVLTGTMGVFLAFAARHRTTQVPLILVGLCFVAVLHGTYDAVSDQILGLVVAAFSAFVFCGYLHTGERINSGLADGLMASRAPTESCESTQARPDGDV